MGYEILPEPDDAEREAIVRALAADEEEAAPSAWAQALLPVRAGDDPAPDA